MNRVYRGKNKVGVKGVTVILTLIFHIACISITCIYCMYWPCILYRVQFYTRYCTSFIIQTLWTNISYCHARTVKVAHQGYPIIFRRWEKRVYRPKKGREFWTVRSERQIAGQGASLPGLFCISLSSLLNVESWRENSPTKYQTTWDDVGMNRVNRGKKKVGIKGDSVRV